MHRCLRSGAPLAGQPTHCPALHAQKSSPCLAPATSTSVPAARPPPPNCRPTNAKPYIKLAGPQSHNAVTPSADNRQTQAMGHGNPSLFKTNVRQAATACDARQPEKAVHRRARASARRGSARISQPCITHAGSPAPPGALPVARYPQPMNQPAYMRHAHDLCATLLRSVAGACLASWEGRLQRHAYGGAAARLPSPAC